jgi:hypothetical protein
MATVTPLSPEERKVFEGLLPLARFVPSERNAEFLEALAESSKFVARGAVRPMPTPHLPSKAPGEGKVDHDEVFMGVISEVKDLPPPSHLNSKASYLVGNGADAKTYIVKNGQWVPKGA